MVFIFHTQGVKWQSFQWTETQASHAIISTLNYRCKMLVLHNFSNTNWMYLYNPKRVFAKYLTCRGPFKQLKHMYVWRTYKSNTLVICTFMQQVMRLKATWKNFTKSNAIIHYFPWNVLEHLIIILLSFFQLWLGIFSFSA